MISTRAKVLLVSVTVLLIVDLLLARLDPPLPPPSSFPTPESQLKFEQLSLATQQPEVVFLGSSFTEAAIDPDLLPPELDAYNLAMPFTDLETMDVWLREVVLQQTAPELVVLTLPVWVDERPVGTGVAEALSHSISSDDGRAGWSWLASHRGLLVDLHRALARERLLAANLWTESGHQTAYHDRVGDPADWTPLPTGPISDAQASRLRALIEMVHAHGSEVVVIMEAIAPAIRPPEDDVDEMTAAVLAVASSLSVEVLSTPPELLADSMFVDGVHVNRSGTAAYTEFIGALLTGQDK